MNYFSLTGTTNRLRKNDEERTRLVDMWLMDGAPPGLFDRVITENCALRKQQLRQLLLFASWVPPLIRCRCYQLGVNPRVGMLHWPSCVEERGV